MRLAEGSQVFIDRFAGELSWSIRDGLIVKFEPYVFFWRSFGVKCRLRQQEHTCCESTKC